MKYQLIQGDNRVALKTLPDNSIDAIVTDPPYGIDFLGKAWDANTGALETYQECLRVLKPGGHILAFSAARTYHHLAITLEQAGFEIRDQIMWLYSSGFPKSQDIGKSIERSEGKRKKLPSANSSQIVGMGTQCPQCGKFENGSNQKKCSNNPCPLKEVLKPADNEWAGWGTALKPAHEPICLARKPIRGSIKDTVQRWGTGALNIDACRVGDSITYESKSAFSNNASLETAGKEVDDYSEWKTVAGRFPSNVIGEIPGYQKYFYCPKVSRKERHLGFDTTNIPTDPSGYQGTSNGGNYIQKKQNIQGSNDSPPSTRSMLEEMGGYYIDKNGQPLLYKDRGNNPQIYLPQCGVIYTHGLKEEYRKWCEINKQTRNIGNNHPTVKPVALMKYLIKLITPPGGTVLDPFNGSGSTGMAAVGLGFNYIGCELDPRYIEISKKRIDAWVESQEQESTKFQDLFDEDAT